MLRLSSVSLFFVKQNSLSSSADFLDLRVLTVYRAAELDPVAVSSESPKGSATTMGDFSLSVRIGDVPLSYLSTKTASPRLILVNSTSTSELA